jgi:hypothetical protein
MADVEVARRYYSNAVRDVTLPYDLGHGVILHSASSLPPLHQKQSGPTERDQICLTICGVEERKVFSWFYAFEHAIHFHGGISLPTEYTITRSGFEYHGDDLKVPWKAGAPTPISEPSLRFAVQTLSDFEQLMLSDTFDRVSNALRLYDAARHSPYPDFALLGFIGCLESLFSIAPQELNFRLCLMISKFTRDMADDQRRHFTELKALYVARSKIAHGDALNKDEERAAIQLVDHWVPMAEEVCRDAIFKLFAMSLVKVFNSRKRHERLLGYLLFYPDIRSAMAAIEQESTFL